MLALTLGMLMDHHWSGTSGKPCTTPPPRVKHDHPTSPTPSAESLTPFRRTVEVYAKTGAPISPIGAYEPFVREASAGKEKAAKEPSRVAGGASNRPLVLA